MLAADLAVTGFAADGEDLIVQYDVLNEAASAFDVVVYRSSDGQTPDAELARVEVTESTALAQGTGHELVIDAAFTDIQEDYFLLVSLDADDDIAESNETNNEQLFEGGIFQTADNIVHVHGTVNGDTIELADDYGDVEVSLGGQSQTFAGGDVAGIHVRSHGGNDDISTDAAVDQTLWVFGGAGSDTVQSGAGGAYVDGGSGNDQLYGGSCDDTLLGGSGDDSLYGTAGSDTLLGGEGSDRLYGGDESDILDGGAGDDFLYGEGGTDVLYGCDGDDWLEAGSGYGNDWLYGEAGNDILVGNDQSNMLDGGAGYDYLYGAAGNDTLYGGDDSDVLYGGSGEDDIYGGDGADGLLGEDGNDTIYGGDGGDYLAGGNGNDSLYGDGDADILSGGSGDDYLNGGNQVDSYLDGGGQAGDEIADRPTILNFQADPGAANSYVFTGTISDDVDPVGLTVTFGGIVPDNTTTTVNADGTFELAIIFEDPPVGIVTASFTDEENLTSDVAFIVFA